MSIWTCEDRTAPFVGVFRRTATHAGYDVRLIAPAADLPLGFAKLKVHYRHLSPNPERFELASFRRWFEIAANVVATDRFIVADSDLVVQTAFSNLPSELRDADGLVGSIGVTGHVLEDAINGGFSLWTGAALHSFCDYMVTTYEEEVDELAKLHAAKLAAGNQRASISDMTLLYRWVHDTGQRFTNSNRVIARQYVDHNFFMAECLGTRFAMELGRKAVDFTRNGLTLRTVDGEPIRPDVLHLGGRYKIMAEDLEAHRAIRIAFKSAYILAGRTGRRLLAALR